MCIVVHPFEMAPPSLNTAENTPGKLEEFFASTKGEYSVLDCSCSPFKQAQKASIRMYTHHTGMLHMY